MSSKPAKPAPKSAKPATKPAYEGIIPEPMAVRQHDKAPKMSVLLANALVTGAPMTEPELHCVIDHMRQLRALAVVSGPRLVNAVQAAVDLHNRAVRRLRGMREEAHTKRGWMEEDERLLEIA